MFTPSRLEGHVAVAAPPHYGGAAERLSMANKAAVRAGEVPDPWVGNDFAGVVVQVGPAVARFAVGDEVYARPAKDRIGTFAELIAVHQDDVALEPAGLPRVDGRGRPWRDHRQVVNGVLWRLRTGAP